MNRILSSSVLRGTIAASVLAISLLFAASTPLRADDDCQKRIAHADHKLHEAAAHHGWDSPEAAKYRAELNEARSYCWEHNHRWWSEDDHKWHTEHDWDEQITTTITTITNQFR